jgi:hypothetical protein
MFGAGPWVGEADAGAWIDCQRREGYSGAGQGVLDLTELLPWHLTLWRMCAK